MLLGVLLTAALLTLLGVNLFLTGERKVEHAIPVLYGARDPRFVRAMGSLLGRFGPPASRSPSRPISIGRDGSASPSPTPWRSGRAPASR